MNPSPITFTIGVKEPTITIIAHMHGNEKVGVKIIEKLLQTITLKKGSIQFVIANPIAAAFNKRFMETDLNRSFPGRSDGLLEEKLAKEILAITKSSDYLLDLHSCSTFSPAFCILRDTTGSQMDLAKMTGIEHVVHYPLREQSGSSLIDYVPCGIGLELGEHDKMKTIKDGYNAIIRLLSELNMIEDIEEPTYSISSQKVFTVTGSIAKKEEMELNTKIVNFSLVKKGTLIAKNKEQSLYAQEDFYPILFGEKAYSDIISLVSQQKII